MMSGEGDESPTANTPSPTLATNLSDSTTEDELLGMVNAPSPAPPPVSDPFGSSAAIVPPAAPSPAPAPPPAPVVNQSAVNAQAKFLEERKAMQAKLKAKKAAQKAASQPAAAEPEAKVKGNKKEGAGEKIYPSKFKTVSVVEPTQRKEGGYFSSSTYWVYKFVVNESNFVIRRFRDMVALENRLHDTCPGCILPPSPDKHKLRAIEEGTSAQSLEFAQARCEEMQTYLTQLIGHPILTNAEPLTTFLTLQDDIGTTWPEVSSSAVTRLKASVDVDVKQKMKVFNVGDVTDDSPQLSDLAIEENERMNTILQAVPKLENATILLKEQSEYCGNVGVEMTKLVKDFDGEMESLRVLSNTLLRSARRSKRAALELSAAVSPLSRQHKLVHYEKKAFADRQEALKIRIAAGRTVEAKQIKYDTAKQDRTTPLEKLKQIEMEITTAKAISVQRKEEANIVAGRLLSEVEKIRAERRSCYISACKIMASSFAEGCRERRAIWEQGLETFKREIEKEEAGGKSGGDGGGKMRSDSEVSVDI
ncbi:hypothetical protein TrVE_jg8163 [Triparma verrucosa]|uniref:PX domain-containing protein n=1 Tax=Triparma verrucosa TaxID=1606542 RepID=A0A9W7F6C9_9STRA|nr:hypothetical protein TrVE_jg8163 [Triparma verrucosa]